MEKWDLLGNTVVHFCRPSISRNSTFSCFVTERWKSDPSWKRSQNVIMSSCVIFGLFFLLRRLRFFFEFFNIVHITFSNSQAPCIVFGWRVKSWSNIQVFKMIFFKERKLKLLSKILNLVLRAELTASSAPACSAADFLLIAALLDFYV